MKRISLCSILALGVALLWWGTAAAAQWQFYGSARVDTFFIDHKTHGQNDQNYFIQSLQTNARIGAHAVVSDALTGRFEYGTQNGRANIRHLYGEWDFGPGRLLIGQTDTPLNFNLSNQVIGDDGNMNDYGQVDAGRRPMVRLSFGDFKIAAIQNDTEREQLPKGMAYAHTLPKIEVSYRLNLDQSYLILAGGYQSNKVKVLSTDTTYKAHSWVLAMGGQVKVNTFYLGGNFWTGRNVEDYGLSIGVDCRARSIDNQIYDNEAYGLLLVAGMVVNPGLAFEAGYGYVKSEMDHHDSHMDDVTAYYLQSRITLADGVYVVPEIGVVDYRLAWRGSPPERQVYYGMKWQVDF